MTEMRGITINGQTNGIVFGRAEWQKLHDQNLQIMGSLQKEQMTLIERMKKMDKLKANNREMIAYGKALGDRSNMPRLVLYRKIRTNNGK